MPKIGRPRAEVVVTDDERAALRRLTKRARVNRAVAFRARIVLACIEASDTAVARRLRTTKTTVAKWRGKFVERRLEGLYDEPRVGAPRTISDEDVEAIIVLPLQRSELTERAVALGDAQLRLYRALLAHPAIDEAARRRIRARRDWVAPAFVDD